jgi:hypothetical protein
MGKFSNIFFIVLAANLVGFALGFVTYEFLFVLLFVVPVEFFVGLLLVFFKNHRETGGALLAASGVTLLVAGFVCSNMSFK